VLLAQDQLRVAPSGHVVGIDLDAGLRMGAARGCDLDVLAELLPAAEAGLSRRCPSTAVGVTTIWVGEPGRHRKGVRTMSNQWHYQVRIDLADEVADVARRDPDDPALAPLREILGRHHATMRCQFDAFAAYVAEAERQGTKHYPLYEWTKATIDDPSKKKKYLKSFTLYVEGQEVYAKEKADALEADLRPIVDGELIKQMFRYDTNPASNPQPPARSRS
jgi:hypothetical protein